MIGNIISAGASLLGGVLGSKAQKEANAQSAANAALQAQTQRDFAQKGIRWRVADARAAGVHPLYALGASTPSYTPQSVSFTPETGLASGVAAAGQDIGRAINATRTAPERANAYVEALQSLQVKNAELDLEIKKTDLASRVARLGQQANPPLANGQLELDKWDKATPLLTGGQPITTDRRWSDGQTFEDRWGEWGGGAAGLAVMIADLLNTNSETAATLRKQFPIDFSARGSLRENSQRLLGRR